MAAAGVQLHALSRFMGHSSIGRATYGHLFPGEEAAAAMLQDAFLQTGTRAPQDSAAESRIPGLSSS